MVDIALAFGAYTVLNLDGGGSSALLIDGEDGAPHILNTPIDHLIPGTERSVGNHLGGAAPADWPPACYIRPDFWPEPHHQSFGGDLLFYICLNLCIMGNR